MGVDSTLAPKQNMNVVCCAAEQLTSSELDTQQQEPHIMKLRREVKNQFLVQQQLTLMEDQLCTGK